MPSFSKVFHTCQCVFSVLLFAQELQNGERHSLPRKERKKPAFRWISTTRIGELEKSTNFQLALTLFRLREIARYMRFFRSHYVTWNTMARVEWVIRFLKQNRAFFLLSLHFSMRHAASATFCLQTLEPDTYSTKRKGVLKYLKINAGL